jgi:hypothetical protein
MTGFGETRRMELRRRDGRPGLVAFLYQPSAS